MRTYTHGLIGWLLYRKGTAQKRKLALIGAILPDSLLAIGYIFHFGGDAAPVQALHTFFHQSPVHTVTIAMHSFVIVVPFVLIAFAWHTKAIPLFVGMLSHGITDLLTHQRGGYNHFFPLDLPQFIAPFSYTGTAFTIAEHLFFVGVVVWMVKKRYHSTPATE